MNLAVVILASERSSAMLPLVGEPLLHHTLDALRPLSPTDILFVTENNPTLDGITVLPPSAVAGRLAQADRVLILPDTLPLLSSDTLTHLLEAHQPHALTLLSVVREQPQGFDRLLRDEQGRLIAIAADDPTDPTQRDIRETHMNVFLCDGAWLAENWSPTLSTLVNRAIEQGQPVQPIELSRPIEALAISSRVQLAKAELHLRQQINQRWLEAGVTMVDPATTYIDRGVEVGPDTIIYPNTHLKGQTVIGRECLLGPNTYIEDSTLCNACEVRFSVVEQATLENHVDIGPFAHLRKGAHLAEGVHMGNFGEVKNSYLGPGTKMGHFSYLGDATLGENVNVGAGTITCNYDGVRKHKTVVGDDSFIGSDTMLVAPLNIGKNSKTGAGAVVTKDVPDDSLAYGVPARVKTQKQD